MNTDNQPNQQALDQACVWMARLWADDVSEQDRRAFSQWHDASPEHAAAWQRTLKLQSCFQRVSDPVAGYQILSRRRTPPSRRRFLTGCAVGILGLSGLAATDQYLPAGLSGADVQTRRGEWQEHQLADGSRLVLNTETSVDIHARSQLQQLQLYQGEFWMETAVEANPWRIRQRDGRLYPEAAHFSVRQHEQFTSVALYQGEMAIAPALHSQPLHLSAGQQLRFDQTGLLDLQPLTDRSPDWLSRRLAVTDMSLSHFIDEVSRYRRGLIRVSNDLPDLQVSGVFSLQHPERILQQLTEILPIRMRYLSRYYILIEPDTRLS
ncbi:MAG: FecR domain-containing protein [Nitrincola lacisaponensis]|uniref:FecR domain-containing protein n=1 Tax=Nitrincola lacisaponensis TaxID=267850 RepID=UPI00391A54FB